MRALLNILPLVGAISVWAPPVCAEPFPRTPDYVEIAKQVGGEGLSSQMTAAGLLFCAKDLCDTLRPSGPAEPEGGVEFSLHSVRLTQGGPVYQADCTEGPSGDPECAFYKAPTPVKYGPEREKLTPTAVLGEAFIVPGDGCLYVVQYWNATHVPRKKYCASKEHTLALAGPPLSFVGIRGIAKADIKLYEAPTKNAKAFHTLKGNAFVEVLLATRDKADPWNTAGEWYLLKDEFGLVGWASREQLQVTQGDSLVKGLGFHGD